MPYETSQSVEAPPAIIAGFEPNTPYFFAISAFEAKKAKQKVPAQMRS